MNTLGNLTGKCVYVGGGSLESFSPVPIFLDKSLLAFKKQVEAVPIDIGEELVVVNGLLTTALNLPSSIPENTQIFLIVPDADLAGNGFIVDVESLYLLEKIIQAMINYASMGETEIDEVIDYMTNVEEQKIEDIFILYGYQVELTHTIPKDSVKLLNYVKFDGELMRLVEEQ